MSIASEITRLQIAKAELKTSIEGKGVTVPSDATLDDYPDLVDAIQTGGGSGFNFAKYWYNGNQTFKGVILPETLIIDFDGNDIFTGFNLTFYQSDGVKTIEIKNLTTTAAINWSYGLYNSKKLEIVKFTDCSFHIDGSMSGLFQQCTKLRQIIGELDLSTTTSINNIFSGCAELVEFRIKQSTLNVSTSGFNQSPLLSDDTLVSLANGLDETATGKTVTLHATPKARCASLMGTNNSGVFEADAQGNMSLETFITTVKGWTLA